MTGKSKKRGRLQRLMRTPLPAEKQITVLLDLTGPYEQSPQYDRVAAIVGPTFIEHALRKAIQLHFKPDSEDPEYNYLFQQDDAPYRDFATLNRLARALGIVSAKDYEHLEMIRQLRNLFAHAMDHSLTFDSPDIAEICDSLLRSDDVSFEILLDLFGKKDSPLGMLLGRRRLFLHAVFSYYWKLLLYDPKDLSLAESSLNH